MIKQLRRRFIAVAMLAMFIVLAVIMGVINGVNYHNIVTEANQILYYLAENDGFFPIDRYMDSKKVFLAKEVDITAETPYETRFFTVTINESGTVIAVNIGNIAAVESTDAINYGIEIYQSGKTSGFMGDYRFLSLEKDSGTMILFVDCHKLLDNFRTFLFTSIIASAIGLLSVLLLVIIFSRMVFQPVAESDKKQKQFITDAGHEIKTPLTIIDANVEVIEMDYGESEWTHSIHNQVARLSTLTKNLISLARMDESGMKIQKMDFSISDAVLESVEGFQAVAIMQEKELIVEVPPDLYYCGEESSIRQLIGILLDNSIKYSDEHGKIIVRLEKKGRGYQLSVFNTADSVEKESLGRLFERFYRSDQSRNSKTGGYGIGLSIARAIVNAHKGKIFAKSEDGKSMEIVVTL